MKSSTKYVITIKLSRNIHQQKVIYIGVRKRGRRGRGRNVQGLKNDAFDFIDDRLDGDLEDAQEQVTDDLEDSSLKQFLQRKLRTNSTSIIRILMKNLVLP